MPFLVRLSPYLIIATILGAIIYQYTVVQEQKTTIKALGDRVSVLTHTLEAQSMLTKEYTNNNKTFKEQVSKAISDSSRKTTVMAKPSLVQKQLERTIEKFNLEMECTTGGACAVEAD